ncbi:MAG: peptide ABC transporter substrate-binding protein [Gemmatimonadetes bacterium]|nr:peptide ABC transporter substrate-binding protein [Gemmatimonadota bacterium]
MGCSVRAPITGITAVWMFFFFFACSAPDRDEPSYGGRVRIGATGGMEPINPLMASRTVSAEVLDLLFERLFAETPDGQLAPALAVAWPFSPRLKFWDILLRSDAQFHDGRPVTAEDVVFTLQLMRKQQNGENLLFERVEALSEDIVRLHYTEPPLSSSLVHLRLHILPKHLVKPQLAAGYSLDELPFNQHPIGSGPFRFADLVGEDHLRLVAFEGYHGGRPYIDTVEVRSDYPDTRYEWAAFMRGESDVALFAAPDDLKSIADNPAFKVLKGGGPSYTALSLNCRLESVLADRRVREALHYAIDRQAIWRLLSGEATADSVFMAGPFPPGSIYNDPQVALPVKDQRRARAILQAAGWADANGDGLRERDGKALELTLGMVKELPHRHDIAAQLRKDLEEVGIHLLMQTEPLQTLSSMGSQLDMVLGKRYSDFDPDITASEWHSRNARNGSGYINAEVDQLIEAGRTAYDENAHIAIYRNIHRHLLEDHPTIFICREPIMYAVRQPLRGLESIMRMGIFRSLPAWYWGRAR